MNSDTWFIRFICVIIGFILGAVVTTATICGFIVLDNSNKSNVDISNKSLLSEYPGQVIA